MASELQEDYWADVVRSIVDPVSNYEPLTDWAFFDHE